MKKVCITGANKGLGLKISEEFNDYEVYSISSSSSSKKNHSQISLLDFKALEEYFSENLFDCIVLNAGIYPSSTILEMQVDEWKKVFDINLTSSMIILKYAAKRAIKAKKELSIIAISSIDALTPSINHPHYNASKAALISLMDTAALEFGKYNIRANCISPGLLNRDGLKENWPEGYNSYIKNSPLSKVVEPASIAKAVKFLAENPNISGANLVIDNAISKRVLF